jgi:hypothetical protein
MIRRLTISAATAFLGAALLVNPASAQVRHFFPHVVVPHLGFPHFVGHPFFGPRVVGGVPPVVIGGPVVAPVPVPYPVPYPYAYPAPYPYPPPPPYPY